MLTAKEITPIPPATARADRAISAIFDQSIKNLLYKLQKKLKKLWVLFFYDLNR